MSTLEYRAEITLSLDVRKNIEGLIDSAKGVPIKEAELEAFYEEGLYEPGVDEQAVRDFWRIRPVGRSMENLGLGSALLAFSGFAAIGAILFLESKGIYVNSTFEGFMALAAFGGAAGSGVAVVSRTYLNYFQGMLFGMDPKTYKDMDKVSRKIKRDAIVK